jgi:hypothetical protein
MHTAGDTFVSIDAIRAQLSRIERQKRELERQMEALQHQKLTALPGQVGLSSVDSLLVALIPYTSSPLRAKLQAIGIDQIPQEFAARREVNDKQIKFSSELKAQIKAELLQGRKSVAALSREYGPSHSTIMGWKREWGMTRPVAIASKREK